MPVWAKHVPPPEVETNAQLEDWQKLLMVELAATANAYQTAPEQIGVLALSELRRNHPWDAAALLTLACYRRHEQTYRAYVYAQTSGMEVARTRARFLPGGAYEQFMSAYADLVRAEVRAYRGANFTPELDRLAAQLGAALMLQTAREDMLRVAMGNIADRYAAEEALHQRVERLSEPSPEQLVHPDLAKAIMEHLREDAAKADHSFSAGECLARAPLFDFRIAALESAGVLNPWIVRAGVRVFERDPQRIVQALSSDHPGTRGHAAVVLGVAEALAYLPAVEAALEKEEFPPVKRALRFALVRMGEAEHFAALQKSAQSADMNTLSQALVLLSWLPPDLQAELPQAWLATIIRDPRKPGVARVAAAQCLANVARHRRLEPNELEALLQLPAAFTHDDEAATQAARAAATLEQLDRHLVLAALRMRKAPLDPWLARLGRIAEPQDLPLLDRLLEQTPADQHRLRFAIVQIAAGISGKESQATLRDWYRLHSDLRAPVAVQLVLRRDVDKRELALLAHESHGATALLLLLALAEPVADDRLREYLEGSDPRERFAAALALKLFGTRDQTQALWSGVDYADERYYPNDVEVRQASLGALLDVELNRRAPTLRKASTDVIRAESGGSARSLAPTQQTCTYDAQCKATYVCERGACVAYQPTKAQP